MMADRRWGNSPSESSSHFDRERRAYEVKEESNYGKDGRFRRYKCHECDVQLHDHENYEKHINGGPHLKKMQRIREMSFGRSNDGSLRTGRENDEKPSHFYDRVRQFNKARQMSPSRSPTSSWRRSRSPSPPPHRRRSPRSPSPSPPHRRRSPRSPSPSGWRSRSPPSPPRPRRRSRSPLAGTSRPRPPSPGSNFVIPDCIRREGNVYKCIVCSKEAKTLFVLQAHLSSKDHIKRTAPVQEYRCELCNLVVSSQETLRQHFEGMNHMRRVKVQEQNDKKIDEYSRRNECYGDDGGNTSAELIQLRRMCQDKDKHIRNLTNEVRRLTARLEYYEKSGSRIKTESDSIAE